MNRNQQLIAALDIAQAVIRKERLSPSGLFVQYTEKEREQIYRRLEEIGDSLRKREVKLWSSEQQKARENGTST